MTLNDQNRPLPHREGEGQHIQGKEKARHFCLAGAVRHEGITWPMCESVAQHTNAFGPHIRSMRSNQRQLRKGISLMAVRRMDWKMEAATPCQV